MAKGGAACVFSSRRKEGDADPDGSLMRHIFVKYEDLENLFHLPLKEAAREIGLCQTTFKKACRRHDIMRWPYVAIKTQHREPVYALAAPALQAMEVHQAKCVDTMSAGLPLWYDGSLAAAVCFPFSATACSSSTVRASSEPGRDCPDPVGADLFSSAPEGQLQQASMAFDTGRVFIGVPLPMPDGLPTTGPSGGEQVGAMPLEAGPPRERSCVERSCVEQSCVEAVMDYLDGPSVSSHLASLLSKREREGE